MAVGYVKFISMNRNTKKNFYKYMTLNPFYFKSIFPGMTIKEAWEYVNSAKIYWDALQSFK
jgi:hypothetical protein